jgi:shikimate kinase
MNIYLIGFMGSGKSFTGQQLATALDLPFVDLDERIEQAEKRSIGQIFESEGESYFRNLEAQLLRATAAEGPAVISCGGGTPCFHQNMEWINANGLSIYLKASVQLLAKRLKKGQEHRPLIREFNTTELEGFIAERLEQREFYYKQAEIIILQDDNQSLVPQLLGLCENRLKV